MAKHTITGRLSLDGVIHEAGQRVELTSEQAVELADLIGGVPTLEDEGDDGEAKPTAGYNRMTKPQLIATLTERGEEFDPNAKNADLIALLIAGDVLEGDQTPTE